jgi:hypothetical protein
MALAGDFSAFVEHSRWWFNIEDFYLYQGLKLSNHQIIRYEDFANQLPLHCKPFLSGPMKLKKTNTRGIGRKKPKITAEIEAMIYQKYRWVFDFGFYDRLKVKD